MADEARALLDQLMGNNRDDVPIQPAGGGRGLAGRSGGLGAGGAPRRANGRSCFDRDICPFYTAWGTDVYDLFVNTKADLGPNPRHVDRCAHEEFVRLPLSERDRLGYERMLHGKLRDLVRQADRTVARNREKLRQELARTKGASDPIGSIDDEKVDRISMQSASLVEGEKRVFEMLERLAEMDKVEAEAVRARLVARETKEKEKKEIEAKKKEEEEKKTPEDNETEAEAGAGTPDAEGIVTAKKQVDVLNPELGVEISAADLQDSNKDDPAGSTAIFVIDTTGDVPACDEAAPVEVPAPPLEDDFEARNAKANLVEQIMRQIIEIDQQKETVISQTRGLCYFRGDTLTDKTVCEVSGNFMSSRDANERIAAHFAGKQYVGWKKVRDKLKVLERRPPVPLGRPGLLGPGPRGIPPPLGPRGRPLPPPEFMRGRPEGPPHVTPRRHSRSRSRERVLSARGAGPGLDDRGRPIGYERRRRSPSFERHGGRDRDRSRGRDYDRYGGESRRRRR